MPWPTAQDYNEAIQLPSVSFENAELKAGKPELTPLGLPKPITGGFASVYKMDCGERSWAIRCFLREYSDQQKRYALISEHLDQIKCPYTVAFEYLARGIRISNQWYPVLKMEWIRGELLNQYVQSHLNSPKALADLAERWLRMINTLNQRGVAHGDLQHGNVLVANGDLRLIDYDGMYVPSLAGQTSHEDGHRNYQHPLRSNTDFSVSIDNFSAWVIYLSLVILSIDPSLWGRLDGGDERLLFQQRDFSEPGNSATLRILTTHREERIQALADFFRSLLYLNPLQIPPLDKEKLIIPEPSIICRGTPDWLSGHLQPGVGATSQKGTGSSNVDISWLFGFVDNPSASVSKSFKMSDAYKLWNIFLIIPLIGFLILLPLARELISGLGVGLSIVFPIFDLALICLLYRGRPELRDIRTARSAFRKQESLVAALESRLVEFDKERAAIGRQAIEKRRRLESKIEEFRNSELADRLAIDKRLKERLMGINSRRIEMNRDEQSALARIQSEKGVRAASLKRQIASLSQEEASKMAKGLLEIQQQFLRNFLSQYKLYSASIPGIGLALKARLAGGGILTASDIRRSAVMCINGIGSSKADALVAWRDRLEMRAKPSMPNSLGVVEAQLIRARIQDRRLQMESELGTIEDNLRECERKVRQEYERIRETLAVEEANIKAETRKNLESVASRSSQAQTSVSDQLRSLMQEISMAAKQSNIEREGIARHLSGAQWELGKLRQQINLPDALTFKRYLVQIFGTN